MLDIGTVTIGLKLRQMRKAHGLTQLELEKLSGVAQGTISRIESGSYKEIPPPDLINPLSKALDSSAAPLLQAVGYVLDSPESEPSVGNDACQLLAKRILRTGLDDHDIKTINTILDIYDDRNRKAREGKQ